MAALTTNYTDMLILVSPDTRAETARIPERPGTIAVMQFEMIAGAPYRYTSDDVIFTVHAERAGIPPEQRDEARAAFFSRGQACLRTSPLVRGYGWGIHSDRQGRVTLVARESPEYAAMAASPDVAKVAGMRSKR